MKTALRRTAAALCGTAALLTGVVVAAPVAQAAGHCSETYPHVNGEGYAYTRSDAHLKKDPYADCTNVTLVQGGHELYLWCYLYNGYGNKWWYVREQGTSYSGYISNDSIWAYSGDDNGDGYSVIEQCV